MATSGNIASGSAAQGQPKDLKNTGSPIQEPGGAGAIPASSPLHLADDTSRNASGGQGERLEGVIRRREPNETDRSQSAAADNADSFPRRGVGENQQQASLNTGAPLPPPPPATRAAAPGSAAIHGASDGEGRSAWSSQPASLQNRRSHDPFADNPAARRASVPRSQVSSSSSSRERPLLVQRSEGDLAAGTGRDQARDAQRRRSTRELDSTRAPAPPLIFASERNNLIDHLLEHQPEVEEAAAAQLPLVFVDTGDEGEADANAGAEAPYEGERAATTGKARQDEGEAVEGYPRAPPHTHAADGRRHSMTDDILPFLGQVTGDFLYNKIHPAHIAPRRASTGFREGVDERRVSHRKSGLSQPARGPHTAPGPIDLNHVVPISEEESPTGEKRRYLPGSVSSRLSATLRDAQEEREKYAYKAKYTGLALNIAIGLQVLLGSLTTGLSAVAVRGKSSAVATTILGALATLVASYLARSRGSNEPELSITRVKDLEQFIRECKNFEQDHGEDMTLKYQPDVERFRSRFENLLGNANGERRLSPTGGALQQSTWA